MSTLRCLTRTASRPYQKRYGFRDKLAIEKFIMDFEVHSHIARRADCITRGGMCMPFHTADGASKRLSVDIDLLTGLERLRRQIL